MNERMRSGRLVTCLVIRAEGSHEVVEGLRVAIGQLRFEMGPDPFVGIEFRCVAGKPLEMETGTPRRQRLHVRPLVNAAAIQQDDHVTAEMTQQGAEKDGDLDIGDVLVGMQVQLEADPAALGTEGDGRNG